MVFPSEDPTLRKHHRINQPWQRTNIFFSQSAGWKSSLGVPYRQYVFYSATHSRTDECDRETRLVITVPMTTNKETDLTTAKLQNSQTEPAKPENETQRTFSAESRARNFSRKTHNDERKPFRFGSWESGLECQLQRGGAQRNSQLK